MSTSSTYLQLRRSPSLGITSQTVACIHMWINMCTYMFLASVVGCLFKMPWQSNTLSVPVNYVTSAKPYIIQIVNATYVNSVPVIPTSVCIDIRRHTIVDSSISITFQSVNLAPKIINARVNDIVKDLCIIPVSTQINPTGFEKGFVCLLYTYFGKFIAMPGELDTLMWVIGNSLVDPYSMSKCTILVGPGGTGKSIFMNYVSNALEGYCDVLAPSIIYGSHDLDAATANKCCSQCMLVYNDVDFEQHDLNM